MILNNEQKPICFVIQIVSNYRIYVSISRSVTQSTAEENQGLCFPVQTSCNHLGQMAFGGGITHLALAVPQSH